MKIIQLSSIKNIPYDLLLTADPSKRMIDEYINNSLIYAAVNPNEEIIGIIVLFPKVDGIMEIKNIAVEKIYQNRGVGTALIKHCIEILTFAGYTRLEVGTGNSSIMQFYFYQKCGFRFDRIIHNFYVNNYEKEIKENGIICRDMIVFSMDV